ncbi:hypothetical protein GQ53DRAFT_740817 [Thozetella sp. PMI_491]|nr:hypothetical protein GQ53DRAFT_740817 [Thozetella sp. PMI_491]
MQKRRGDGRCKAKKEAYFTRPFQRGHNHDCKNAILFGLPLAFAGTVTLWLTFEGMQRAVVKMLLDNG